MSTPKSKFPLRKRRLFAVFSAFLLLAIVSSTLASAAEVSLFGSVKQFLGLNAETSTSAPAPAQTVVTTAQPVTIGACDTAGPIEVESTGGTTSPTAYATLKAAFDAINAGTHTGSINIEVCGNTTETATAALTASGLASTSYTDVTIRPVGGARIIEGSIVGAIIRLNGADNVTIDGRQGGAGTARDLTVRNNNTASATAAIWLSSVAAGNGAANNTVRNLEIAAGANMTASDNSTFGIIMCGTTISTTANGVDNDNNSFIANRIVKARYGIVTRGTTTDLNINPVVTDNIVGPTGFGTDQIGKNGIFMQADTGALVSRNTVQFVGCLTANTCTGADRLGISVGSEAWSATTSTTLTSNTYTITKNIIHDIVDEKTFSSVGIEMATTGGGSATNNLVANNFVYNVRSNGTSGDQPVGIGYVGGHTDRVVFNSIGMAGDMDPAASSASTYGAAIRVSNTSGSTHANLTMANNSIYLDASSNTATVHYYAISLPSATYSFGTGFLNFNNYYINPANAQLRTGSVGTGTGASNTTEFATLANWQAALTPAQDANSKQADPLYASPTSDLHISALSPNIDMATAIAGIADDVDSQVRPNGAASDIGADEFYASPGQVQLSSATYSVTELAGTATITVTRTSGSSGAVSVNFATSDGTAVGGASCGAGIDYVTTSGTLNWADGDTAPKTFTITVCNDGILEGSETVNITLSNPTGGVVIGSPSSAVLTILNSSVFGGSVNVGTGETFTSLTNPGGLFENINTGAITANTVINITSDLTAETGAVALNEFAGGFTLTIQPSGGARLISGSNATALLNFNGADGVTITGLTGSSNLTIRNTGTGAAILFINDASNNTVTKTTLEAGANSSVLFISTGVTTGNDNIMVDGNVIRDRTDAAGVPFNSINVIGSSATVSNSNILINNNQIINFLQAGIVIGTSDNITFTFNDILQTASRTTSLFGVAVNSAAGTNLFSQNTIHDLTTTLNTTGMAFNDARSTTVSRNNIFNFPSTSGSTGVLTGILSNGSSGNPASLTVVNNMVSIIPSFTNNQSIFGIRDFGFAGNTFTSYFNSVLVGGTNTAAGTANSWACQRGFSAPTAYTMIDNICFNNRTGAASNHFAAGDESQGTGTFVSDYNIFVGTGVTAANFFDKATSSTAVPVDFVSWQAGPPTRDANSQASNPGGNYTVANMFVAANDLHLNTSGTNPALNAGTPAGGVTNDFDGQTRPSGSAPEIGADEIVPVVVTNVQFSSATYTGAEGTSATITVTRTGDTTGASSVNYATSDGTATGGAACGAGVDYVTTSGTVNFAAGETSKTFSVTLCSDAIIKGDETINLTLSSPSGATLGSPSTAVLTITNVNPPMPGTLALSSSTYTVGEAGGTVTITVNRTGGTDGAVSVNYTLADGTATGGAACGGAVDYVNAGGTVNFAAGQSSQTFTVAICNDAAIEDSETFTVTLSGATGGATIGSPSSATVTITDDDVAQPGTLALSSATYTVGEAAGTVTVTVNRTSGTDGAVSVNYTLTDGTATGGAACGGAVDYVNMGGTVNFAAGQSSQTFTVTICNDAAVESNETFTVTLSGATGGATIGTPSSATVTITDDDTAPPAGNVIVNPGNVAYNTLKEAFDAINAGTHTGAVTIDIAGNTTETASAVLNASGTGTANYSSVVIAPTGGARVVEGTIVGAVIKLNGADNVTIDGRLGGAGRNLTVRNNSTATATAAIWLASVAAGNGAANNVIRNLEVATGATANTGTNTTIGILMAGTTVSVTADGTDNDNNQFIANRITKARYGLVTRGTATNNNEGLVITDNIVGAASFGANEIGKVGLFLQGDTGAVVSRNTVQFVGGDLANTTAGADRCGICIGGENWGVTESGVFQSGDYNVTKNNVHDIVDERTFSAIGIRLGTTRLGAATNNLVANNFVYNVRANSTAGDQAAAIGYAAGHTDRIVFNSISMTGDMDPGTAASSTIYGNALRVSTANGTNNANLTMMNNSIYLDVNSNTAANHYYAITLPSAAYSFGTGGLNFNNYYINPANPQLRTGGLGTASANTPGTEFLTLANWQAALTTPQDANSKQADPVYFSNTSDLHIQSTSPNIDMATAIAGVTDDIDSQVRPNGAAPDIGADEFYPAPGTLQFSSANYSATEASGVVTITVTRAGGASGAVSVNYSTSDGTAVGGASCGAGVDYVTTSGTLNWADNDFTPKTFNVTICNDGIFKSAETFNVTLSNPTGGATLGTPSTATVTILDSTIFGGSVNVGAGQTFTSLTNPGGLFEAINNGSLNANLTVNITSDLTAETGAIALNQFAGGFTLTIQPSGGARLISGGSATVLLDFNGADGVTINGLNSGGNSLTIRNTAVGTGTAVRFINDASGNSVLNTTLEGGGTSSVLFISTGVTTGNDNITVTGNIIRDRTDATSIPFNVINLAGTSATVSNSNILVNNNQLINFAQAGLFVANADNVTFTGNDVFQTASRTTALFGVAVNSMLGTNLISQNTIHDLTTTLATTGMAYNDVRATTVSRNRIYNFPSTSGSTGVLTGIVFNGASGAPASLTVVNNMVSIIPNFTNNQSIFGIRDFGFATNVFTSYFNSTLIGGTGSGTANTWACQRGFSAPTAYTMLNNICFNNRTGGTGNHFAAGDESQGTGTFVSNYNIFVGTGATPANFFDKATSSTAVPVNFASWQAGPPTRDANSQASNPGGNYTVANMFVSPTDLHLNTSGTNPALNAGTAVEGVTIDFDGQTRDSMPDIGADEVVFNLPGTLSLSSSTYSVPENGVMVTITVNRAMGTVGAVSVGYTLGNGTATGGAACGAGIDFVNTGGTVNFAEGESTKTFIVQICDDTTFEGDETFTVTLTNPQGGAVLGTPSSAVVTIVENDPMPVVPSLSINDVTVQEGNSGTTTATFTVSVTNPNDQPITVQYMTVNGTAIAGSDYVATSGTLTIPAGQTSATITVNIIGDAVKEANETFFVILSNPTNATITDNQGVGVIIDNDRAVVADFDGDRKSDFSVWRPADGYWYILPSTSQILNARQFGANGDKIVPGDYDGDGKTDLAVFRPSEGNWYVQRSSDFGFVAVQFGNSNDIPVQGDYNGDGKTDFAVFRPSTGEWYIARATGVPNQNFDTVQFGQNGDRPVQGDYDGDAKTDVAVYRGGNWYVLRSSDGAFVAQQFGIGSDVPVVGDFDGDGRVDFTVYRDNTWYILQSLSGGFRAVQFGTTGDIPMSADFDGDGISDITVFRPSNGFWYVLRSSDGAFVAQQWGQNADVPVPAAYQPRP